MAGEDGPTFFGEAELIVRRVLALRSEAGDIDWDQLAGAADEQLTTENIAYLLLALKEWQTAAGQAVKAVTDELARRFVAEERTSLDTRETLITFKPKKSVKVKDASGFWEYMRANPELIEIGFNPNDLRKTGIPESVFTTFFEETIGVEPVIGAIPHKVLDEIRARRGGTQRYD